MAVHDCKAEPVTTQARHYKVGYRPNLGKGTPSPQLIISGRWLEQLGFNTGQPVTVTAEQGRLIILIQTTQ